MKHTILTILIACAVIRCAGSSRNPQVVAAEAAERQKPLLNPPGGVYFRGVDAKVTNFGDNLEYSTGGDFMPLLSDTLSLRGSATLRVRPRSTPALATSETYEIAADFTPVLTHPAPGSYATAQVVTLSARQKNVRVQVRGADGFNDYDAEMGITIAASANLEVRQCTAAECSAPEILSYQIVPPVVNPPAPRALTQNEADGFVKKAATTFQQSSVQGLAALMDEAKLLVIQDSSLIANAALRQRFLSQNNTQAAAEACTTVARYLYASARRLTLGDRGLPDMPDFPRYYIRHIADGSITVDSTGVNFVWVANGPALVNPYLPKDALQAFDVQRGTLYPTDYSLLDKLNVLAPEVALLRDGPSGTSHTHTFFAIRNGVVYTMADTYFRDFNGIETRASAGKSWPFAFRFGPAGSRYLHFVYGY